MITYKTNNVVIKSGESQLKIIWEKKLSYRGIYSYRCPIIEIFDVFCEKWIWGINFHSSAWSDFLKTLITCACYEDIPEQLQSSFQGVDIMH